MKQKAMPHSTGAARRGPDHPEGIRRVQVGCGPHSLMDDWWNVDIREFKGVDAVMDVTKPWPWRNRLDFVYGEHFLEHLDFDRASMFLRYVREALRPGGRVRLSTPCLEWVLATHFDASEADPERAISQTLAINRAFHGWGSQVSLFKAIPDGASLQRRLP